MSPEPPERPHRRSRRRFLRSGAGALAAFSTASAGCVATLPPLGQRIRYGRVDAPEPGPPDYRRWLPAPSAFQDPPRATKPGGVAWHMTYAPGNLGADVVGENFSFPIGITRDYVDYLGVGYEHYDRVVWFGSTFAVEADVDRSTVRATLDPTGYDSLGAHRGYDVYGREDVPRAMAVGDRGFVYAHGDGAVPDARAVVDAETGASPRYHETSETLALLSSAAGAGPFTWSHGLDEDVEELASASSFTFDEDAVYYVWTRVYPDGETPSKQAVQRELAEEGGPAPIVDPRAARDVDVAVDDRVVTIEHRQSHERFRESNQAEAPPPHVTWGVDHDRDARTVTLHHETGDPVPADELLVGYDPVVHDEDEPTIATQFADEYDTVSPGDSLTVDVSNWPDDDALDAELRITWQGPGDEGRTVGVLLRYDPD